MVFLAEQKLKKEYSGKIVEIYVFKGDLNVVLLPADIPEIFRFLKTDPDLRYNFLSCITAVDYLNKRRKRFEVVYMLYSIANQTRIIVKTRVNEDEEVPSLTSLWGAADWQEREIYDLFGLKFSGHPSLVRILLDDDWIGHPLRKDFPLTYEMPHFSFNKEETEVKDKSPIRGDE